MTRCNSCNGILTKTDVECFVCGERVPGARKRSRPRAKLASAAEVREGSSVRFADAAAAESQPRPISPMSNLVFLGSMVLTALSFLSEQRLAVVLSLGLSVILLSIRILDGRAASKASGADRDSKTAAGNVLSAASTSQYS